MWLFIVSLIIFPTVECKISRKFDFSMYKQEFTEPDHVIYAKSPQIREDRIDSTRHEVRTIQEDWNENDNLIDSNFRTSNLNYFYATSKNWMSRVPDNLKLSEMSIPGTYQSASYASSIPVAQRTQDESLANQLDIGIRFFHFYLKFSQNSITLFAQDKTTNISFEQMLKIFQKFLKDQPSETIIMLIRLQDAAPKPPTNLIAQFYRVIRILKMHNTMVYQKTIPTLGSVRGKIFLFAPIKWLNTIPFENHALLQINDPERTNKYTVKDKINALKGYFKSNRANTQRFNVNNLNSHTVGKTPKEWATLLTFEAFEELHFRHLATAEAGKNNTYNILGIVLMDFPTEILINEITKINKIQNIVDLSLDKAIRRLQEFDSVVKFGVTYRANGPVKMPGKLIQRVFFAEDGPPKSHHYFLLVKIMKSGADDVIAIYNTMFKTFLHTDPSSKAVYGREAGYLDKDSGLFTAKFDKCYSNRCHKVYFFSSYPKGLAVSYGGRKIPFTLQSK